jgi:hypothetical protein
LIEGLAQLVKWEVMLDSEEDPNDEILAKLAEE